MNSFTIIFLIYDLMCGKVAEFAKKKDDSSRNKKILLWTSMFEFRDWTQPLGQEAFLQCPEQRYSSRSFKIQTL